MFSEESSWYSRFLLRDLRYVVYDTLQKNNLVHVTGILYQYTQALMHTYNLSEVNKTKRFALSLHHKTASPFRYTVRLR